MSINCCLNSSADTSTGNADNSAYTFGLRAQMIASSPQNA
jgi:hypothetical protein